MAMCILQDTGKPWMKSENRELQGKILIETGIFQHGIKLSNYRVLPISGINIPRR